jgi:2-polyprenyl-6-methoxyphenol hydroxylase-like FAD-dependent oxidoreductase
LAPSIDLIVAADGANSAIRTSAKSLVQRDRLYRWGAVVCLLDDWSGVGGDEVFQSFGGVRHVSIWPVGSRCPTAPRRINVSINVPVNQLEAFRDPEVWKRHVTELCPRIVPLLGQAIGKSELTPYTYRDVVLRRYYDRRLVFIGDAAHCMSPQLGQGACMSLLDSWVLCQALERNQDMVQALTDFDRERRLQVSAYQFISRLMTPLFQSESRTLALLRDRGFYRLSQLPFVKGSMLKTLSGRREGRSCAGHLGFADTP